MYKNADIVYPIKETQSTQSIKHSINLHSINLGESSDKKTIKDIVKEQLIKINKN